MAASKPQRDLGVKVSAATMCSPGAATMCTMQISSLSGDYFLSHFSPFVPAMTYSPTHDEM